MNRHKHAELMAQYAQDAMTTYKPWVLWEVKPFSDGNWLPLKCSPYWHTDQQYRRIPKQHTIVLNTEQLREVVMACSHVGWENEDFAGAVQRLVKALNGEQV
jgi:hypothetical protein